MREERLNSLLSAWQEQQRQGCDVSAAELCRDCPELAEELSRRIGVLRQVNQLLQPANAAAGRGPEPPQTAPPASPQRAHPGPADTDRNLLFGILALQMDCIGRDALISGMNAWVLDKAKPLGQILVEQAALTARARDKLEAVVELHLEMHGGDAQKSLAAVSSIASVRQELQQVADADLQGSLAQLSTARPEEDPWATRAPAVGQASVPGMRFRILHKHAEGGLGAVFVAEDQELHRQVALKEIKEKYADHADSRSRFLREAEVTGGLEHPGIVPVYGLGRYPDGRPFYAMRFIKGDSLRDAIQRFHAAEATHRDPGERSLAFRELLGRFVDACNALAYAHARGILHRDVKPHNIMLGKYGETLVVDWGLAKVIGSHEGLAGSEEGTLYPLSGEGTTPTQAGDVMGTPAYMSPEQAGGELERLGPASDIYSLGATLYELLTGTEPVHGHHAGEILTKVKRGDWLPPRKVHKDVPAALDAVCCKAMALRPEERYGSALELAEDIEHWLADEPVSAWPEPWTRRLVRWCRQHKTLVTAAAMLLVASAVLSSVAAVMIAQERNQKEQQRQAAEEARERAVSEQERADKQAEITRAINDFLQRDLLLQASSLATVMQRDRDLIAKKANPIAQRATAQQTDPDVKMRTVLDRAAERIGERFRDQPLIEAAIRRTIGMAYAGLHQFAAAQEQLEKSVRLFREHLGPEEPRTLEALEDLAQIDIEKRLGDRAEPILVECLQARRRINGEKDRATLFTTVQLAQAYLYQNKLSEAEALLGGVLDRNVDISLQIADDLLLSWAANTLALVYQFRGEYDKAEALHEKVLEADKRRFGEADPNVLRAMHNLATIYSLRGKDREAEPLFLKCLESERKIYREDQEDIFLTRGETVGSVFL